MSGDVGVERLLTDGGEPVADINSTMENCEECGEETRHKVELEIRYEMNEGCRNAEQSKEPYRFTECEKCGYEEATRMNGV